MAQLIVRNIESNVKDRLQQRARQHGHSMEAEIRNILRNTIQDVDTMPIQLGSRISQRFQDIGLDEPITELRGYDATPVNFDADS